MHFKNEFLTELVVIIIGGSLGGGLRFLLSLLPLIGSWPLTTLFINWLGAFCLAWLGAAMAEKDESLHLWQSFLGTGVLGGFTTFSTMMLQFYQQSLHQPLQAIFYLLLTLVGGWILVDAGHAWARKVKG